jgi:hypothetical protein
MKTIELSDSSPELTSLLGQASDEDLVVKLPDGRQFIVVAIDDFDDEIARTRANPKIMALLDARAKSTATLSLDEARHRLGL